MLWSHAGAVAAPGNPYAYEATATLVAVHEGWCWTVAGYQAMPADAELIGEHLAYAAYMRDLASEELARRRRLYGTDGAPPVSDLPDRAAMRDELRAIKDRLDLCDTIQRYAPVTFEGRGTRRTCRCPFPWHDDGTPSFTVYTDQQRWHCFGCNLGGDLFEFLRQFLGIGVFQKVVDVAREMAGLSRPERTIPKPAQPKRVSGSSTVDTSFEFRGGRVLGRG